MGSNTLLAVLLVHLLALCAALPARAEEVAVSARIVTMLGNREHQWTELYVDGTSDAAFERCQRLLRAWLRKPRPVDSPVRDRVARDCAADGLPARGATAGDALLLRTAKPLPAADLFALGAPGTSGRIVTYVPMGSAEECQRSLHPADGKEPPRPTDNEVARRLAAEQICDTSTRMEASAMETGRSHRKVSRTRKVQLDLARRRCTKARTSGEGAARRPATDEEASTRTCVRE